MLCSRHGGGHLTPVALWTGRLPGLRPLPRPGALWLTSGIVLVGAAGAFGLLGAEGPWLGAAASLAAGWTVLRHRWPKELPTRLRSLEPPQGPDERAVVVGFRHDGDLLGWDVGILWFERGGVGFVGRTVSFVLPRSTMRAVPAPPVFQSLLRAPQMTAKVFETTVGILPLAKDLDAQMTLARIDALPDENTSETILPPSSMHPDLLRRGLAIRRRMPLLVAMQATIALLALAPILCFNLSLVEGAAKIISILVLVDVLPFRKLLPPSIRSRLPKEPRRKGRKP